MAVVSIPPSNLSQNGFYSQYLDVLGIPLIGSSKVETEAFYVAAEIIGNLIIGNDQMRAQLINLQMKAAIIDQTEAITDLPEYANLNTVFPGTNWSAYRGLGAVPGRAISSGAEENLLKYPSDPYLGAESVLLHEFSHGIETLYVSIIGDVGALTTAYNNAVSQGLWTSTYAITDIHEYFAELTQVWFNDNPEPFSSPDGIHNNINTRIELQTYDPLGYAIMQSLYRDDNWTVGDFLGTVNADIMVGSKNDDYILGRDGNDNIDGKAGDDFIFGGAGNDTLIGGAGNNTLDGGAGTDIAKFTQSESAYNVVQISTSKFSVTNKLSGEIDTLIDIEQVQYSDKTVALGDNQLPTVITPVVKTTIIGGSGADVLTSILGNSEITGNAGHDKIFVLSGINSVDGGADSDLIIGGFAADDLKGGAGNDVIRGDASGLLGGTDRITGGAGDDVLMGGQGADVFSFKAGDGSDVIGKFTVNNVIFSAATGYSVTASGADFQSGVDHIELASFSAVNSSNVMNFVNDGISGAVFSAEGTEIVFLSVSESQLSASDFLFV